MALIDNDLPSFGALLKIFRTRKHFTQQRLAEAIGVHRHAVGRWEQGDFLPASRAIVLELARHLSLDTQESRQLLETSLTALAPYWSVPLPRNPFFTGRKQILETLHTQLRTDYVVALTQSSAVHGLGGVGKTQTALEYTYRYALEYRAVFWIRAETEEHIVSSLLHIAEVLQLPGRDDKDQQRVIETVQRWLTMHKQWLLIWDNLEDLNLLSRFLPPTRHGAILLTTRSQALGTLAQGTQLASMEHEEGIRLLLLRARRLDPEATSEQVQQLATRLPAEYTAAEELVLVLGGLPLALDQAGAYLEETGCGIARYLQLYTQQRIRLLDRRGGPGADHPQSVKTTFLLSMERVEREHCAASALLHVCALLHAEAIPEELFVSGAAHLGPDLECLLTDSSVFDQAVAVLRSLSLVQRQIETCTLSLHRLVQVVLLDTLTEQEREQWIGRAIGALNEVFPEMLPTTEYAIRKQGERLLPHAFQCLSRVESAEESLALASLAYKVAQYLRECGRYAEAEPLYQRALHIRERIQGCDHSDVARVLNYLAVLYWQQSKYAEAEPLYQRTLLIREHVLGPHHPDVAASLNNLALLYWSQGKYAEAEPLYQRALHIRELAQGSDHPDVATSLNNLATLYWEQGKYAEAEPLYQRTLLILKHTLSSDHPLLAQTLNNLALLFRDQKKYREAEPLYQQALSMLEQALGPDHPEVPPALNNLANLYQDQERYTAAESLYRRALHIRERGQEFEHPDVATSLNGLANLARNQGNYKEAEPLYQRALSIHEQHLGRQHPETAQTLHDLALFHLKQKHLCEAHTLAEDALKSRAQSLGDAHPKTVATRVLYAQIVQEQSATQTETEKTFSYPYSTSSPSFSQYDPLQKFLDICCELHPRACCRISDLWQAYEHWAQEDHERFPLSRRDFTTQIKAHGCHTARTNTARIWHGITLIKHEP